MLGFNSENGRARLSRCLPVGSHNRCCVMEAWRKMLHRLSESIYLRVRFVKTKYHDELNRWRLKGIFLSLSSLCPADLLCAQLIVCSIIPGSEKAPEGTTSVVYTCSVDCCCFSPASNTFCFVMYLFGVLVVSLFICIFCTCDWKLILFGNN